jgi:hypothetical protein
MTEDLETSGIAQLILVFIHPRTAESRMKMSIFQRPVSVVDHQGIPRIFWITSSKFN